MTKRKLPRLPTAALVLLASISCGGDDDEKETENPDAEACEHIGQGPFTSVTATTTAADAPAVVGHTAYDVTLPTGAPGFLQLIATKAGAHVVYTNATTTVNATSNATSADVAASSTTAAVSGCSAIKGRVVFPLSIGTYALTLSSAEKKVRVVMEAPE